MGGRELERGCLERAAVCLQRVPRDACMQYLEALAGLLKDAARAGRVTDAAWKEYAAAAAAVRLAGGGNQMQMGLQHVQMAAFDYFRGADIRAEQDRPAGPAQVVELRHLSDR